jgi:hypothetical protein
VDTDFVIAYTHFEVNVKGGMACGMACGMHCGTKNDVNFATIFTGDAKHPENLILKHMERYPTGDPYQPVAYTARKEIAHHYHAILTCVMKRHPSIFSTFHG